MIGRAEGSPAIFLSVLTGLSLLFILAMFSCANSSPSSETLWVIHLTEDSNQVMSFVSHMELNSDNSQMLVSDSKSGRIFLYRVTDGHLLKILKAERSFSDSMNSDPLWDSNYVGLDSAEIEKHPRILMDKHTIFRGERNECDIGYFLNDSTALVLGLLRGFATRKTTAPLDTSTQTFHPSEVIAQSGGLFRFSLRAPSVSVSQIGWDKDWHGAAQNNTLVLDPKNHDIFINVADFKAASSGHYNSAWSFAKYTYDGKRERLETRLPDFFRLHGLSYQGTEPKGCLDSNGNLWAFYGSIPKLFNLTNKTELDLPIFTQTKTKNDTTTVPPLFALSCVATTRGTLVATCAIVKNYKPWHVQYIAIEVDSTGKVLREKHFSDVAAHGNLQYLQFVPRLDCLLCYSLDSKVGWTCAAVRF